MGAECSTTRHSAVRAAAMGWTACNPCRCQPPCSGASCGNRQAGLAAAGAAPVARLQDCRREELGKRGKVVGAQAPQKLRRPLLHQVQQPNFVPACGAQAQQGAKPIQAGIRAGLVGLLGVAPPQRQSEAATAAAAALAGAGAAPAVVVAVCPLSESRSEAAPEASRPSCRAAKLWVCRRGQGRRTRGPGLPTSRGAPAHHTRHRSSGSTTGSRSCSCSRSHLGRCLSHQAEPLVPTALPVADTALLLLHAARQQPGRPPGCQQRGRRRLAELRYLLGVAAMHLLCACYLGLLVGSAIRAWLPTWLRVLRPSLVKEAKPCRLRMPLPDRTWRYALSAGRQAGRQACGWLSGRVREGGRNTCYNA
jgi:hypothetical protein